MLSNFEATLSVYEIKEKRFQRKQSFEFKKNNMDYKLGASMNVNLAQHFNPFYATALFLTP